MSDHLHRIQADYAAAHEMGYEVAGLTTFTAIATWWRSQEARTERERTAALTAASAPQEDQDGTNDHHPTG